MISWQEWIDSTDGLMSAQECEELARWASMAACGVALEVGHYTGLSTCVLLDSLPPTMPLITVDARKWRPEAAEVFDKYTPQFERDRPMRVFVEPFQSLIPRIADPIGFVFYDADHTAAGNRQFWSLVREHLADDCIVVYDDADWEGPATLQPLAEEDGFKASITREWYRHVTEIDDPDSQVRLDIGKRHPDTFTLQSMVRGGGL